MPDFEQENKLWNQGFNYICGVDEVGRGSWAGPIMAAAVILIKNPRQNDKNVPRGTFLDDIIIRDSKQMTAKQREKSCEVIIKKSLSWAIGQASVQEIDSLGLTKANVLAMQRAVNGLLVKPDYILSDGNIMSNLMENIPILNIIKGDDISNTISAASIVAKVTRDKLMSDLNIQIPNYDFDKNKGYGTGKHRTAILNHGVTTMHRKSFAPIIEIMNSKNVPRGIF